MKNEQFLLSQSKTEAKRLLKLSKVLDGALNISKLSEAQEVIAQIKGKSNWHELVVGGKNKAAAIKDKSEITLPLYGDQTLVIFITDKYGVRQIRGEFNVAFGSLNDVVLDLWRTLDPNLKLTTNWGSTHFGGVADETAYKFRRYFGSPILPNDFISICFGEKMWGIDSNGEAHSFGVSINYSSAIALYKILRSRVDDNLVIDFDERTLDDKPLSFDEIADMEPYNSNRCVYL